MRYIQGMPVGGIALGTLEEVHAQDVIDLMLCAYGETEFLSCTPEEFRVTVEEERAFLRRYERSERDCMIGAWVNGALAGNVSIAAVGGGSRVRHRAELGICVRREFWGRGVGSMLMDAAIQTAECAGYRQIELRTAADNDRALRLYERFGFVEFGRCPRALKRGAEFADEIWMIKHLR